MTNNTGILGYINEQKKQREQEAKNIGQTVNASANKTMATQTIAKLKHLLKSPSAE